MADENPDWGAPRIHGKLQKLGCVVSERSVARYLRRVGRRGDPYKRWLTFLQNHHEAIVISYTRLGGLHHRYSWRAA